MEISEQDENKFEENFLKNPQQKMNPSSKVCSLVSPQIGSYSQLPFSQEEAFQRISSCMSINLQLKQCGSSSSIQNFNNKSFKQYEQTPFNILNSAKSNKLFAQNFGFSPSPNMKKSNIYYSVFQNTGASPSIFKQSFGGAVLGFGEKFDL